MLTTISIIALIIIISLAVAVLSILVYDKTMTPSNQADQIQKINEYLSRLIVGYTY